MKSWIATTLFLFLAAGPALAQIDTIRFIMDGGQEVPPVTTTGTSRGTVFVDIATNTVTVIGAYSDLSSAQVSVAVYDGLIGVDSGVALTDLPITGMGGTTGSFFGQGTVSPLDAQRIRDGRTYISLATTGHPGGELRGQIVQHLSIVCPAELPTDPMLNDASGEATYGPNIGSSTEAFNTLLDCSGAPTQGVYSIVIRAQKTAGLPSPLGTLWAQGPRYVRSAGLHGQGAVFFATNDVVLPADTALVGLQYVVQGFCGGSQGSGRLSNAIVEMVGIGS